MNEPHSTVSGVITYTIGAVAAFLSQTSLNGWLIFFSLVLVILRIAYETYEFVQRRADRKAAMKKKFGIVDRG